MAIDENQNIEIKSIENSYAVLRFLLHKTQADLNQITKNVGMSKSSVHKHLRTLSTLGMVEKTSDGYKSGMELLTMGGSVRDRHPLFLHARTEIAELAEDTGEIGVLSVPYRNRSLTLHQVRGSKAMNTDAYLGIQQSMYCTATGKSMLAFFTADRRKEIIDNLELRKRTSNTITSESALLEELEAIRKKKYARNDEERLEGMRAVASPIIDRNDDRVHGAIAVAAPARRLRGDLLAEELPHKIRRTAEMIEMNVSYE